MPDDRGWIAVVEDDPIMGESLQRGLELEGWRATWWRTGSDALRFVRECSPDLVLCDIRLGDMNGEEVFRVANSRSRGSAVHLHDRLWADRPGGFADARRSPRLSHKAVRTRIAASEGGRDNCASTPRRRGRRARRIGKDATNRGVAPPHRYAVHAHSDYGGNRFRQGGVRAIPSWNLGRGEGSVHGGQLRRHSRRSAGKRSVRARKGRVFRRAPTASGICRARARRRAVPRRNRRHAAACCR